MAGPGLPHLLVTMPAALQPTCAGATLAIHAMDRAMLPADCCLKPQLEWLALSGKAVSLVPLWHPPIHAGNGRAAALQHCCYLSSEFAGIASSMELFGIPTYVSVPISADGVWLLTVMDRTVVSRRFLLAISLLCHVRSGRRAGSAC